MTETELLFTHIFKCDRVSLYLDKERRLSGNQGARIAGALRRRMSGEPLAYILGSCEFMGLEFKVDPRCLIPRPETELLVEAVIRRAGSAGKGLTIADIGTGSGAIAVSLAKFLPSAKIIAGDISEPALELARENAAANDVAERIVFMRADLLSGLREGACDIIVSNPPYVVSGEIDGLEPEVRSEPRLALDGGPDGLDFYRKMCAQASRFLRARGLLFMEIGAGQCPPVCAMVRETGLLEVIDRIKDYSAIERVIVAARS